MTKLKHSKYYKTQQLKYNKNEEKKNLTKLKNQFVKNLIRLNCERKKTHKLKIVMNKFKPQVVTKLKNSYCNNTEKLELGHSSTQI